VSDDCSPYSLGGWSWIAPWGWTWIDASPWGFAPFHYGRWFRWHNRWSWVPGPRSRRSVYAPALVGWLGGRGAGAGVAWFPLGPREAYTPGYAASQRYLSGVNLGSSPRSPNARYVNGTVPGAVTAVSQGAFTSGRAIRSVTRLSSAEVAQAGVTAMPPAIAPTRQSVLGPGGARAVMRPAAAVMNRPVVARLAPPAAPASFDRQLAAIHANGDRPVPGRSFAPTPALRGSGMPATRAAPGLSSAGTAAPAVDMRTLAERVHTLQTSVIPPVPPSQRQLPPVFQQPVAPRTSLEYPQGQPGFARPAPAAPAMRADRPPWAQQAGGRPAQVPENAPEERPPGSASAIEGARTTYGRPQAGSRQFEQPQQRQAEPPQRQFEPPQRQAEPAQRQFEPPQRQLMQHPPEAPPQAARPAPQGRPPEQQPRPEGHARGPQEGRSESQRR